MSVAETEVPFAGGGTSSKLVMRNLRIVSGLILVSFVATHLLNHSLGLVSIDAMEAMRSWRVAVTRHPLVTTVLVLALLVHALLGVWAFLMRRSWRTSLGDAVQLGFGLLIPIFLFRHIIGTRMAHEIAGIDDNYTYALYVIWPNEALNQAALVFLVWVHGLLGIHFWLRVRPWYRTIQPVVFGVGLLLPVLAYAGFTVAGRNIRFERAFETEFPPGSLDLILTLINASLWGYAGVLVLLVAVRGSIWLRARLARKITVQYAGGRTVSVAPGPTLLEISRANSIPHASICNGRARCSTCRVRVVEGHEQLERPDEMEARVLKRVGATKHVRLACQMRPRHDVSVMPLLPGGRSTAETTDKLDKFYWGVEQEVTLLFADVRGFTSLSEEKLPYDVVFLLNQFLSEMSGAITDAGGYVDKFMGDGIMAIFGIDKPAAEGAGNALNAVRVMSELLVEMNKTLKEELGEPLRIGIGLHTGPAILGRVGSSSTSGAGDRITALGDTVNTASRLEAATKELQVQLAISAITCETAGFELPADHLTRIGLRGKSQPVTIVTYENALDLPKSF